MTITENRKKGLLAVCVLALVQSALRFGILGVVLQNGWPATEHAVSSDVELFINVMFLLLGIGGIVLTYGLFEGRRWGYIGTIGISAITIVFDVWAIFAVQPTALLGIILPVVFIGYLFLVRNDFVAGVRVDERVGGVRN
ncbi:MAG TPA: hypothetical protein VGK23_06265 [Methanomassiliicoccales archaeon]|jgi:hypothetical protein